MDNSIIVHDMRGNWGIGALIHPTLKKLDHLKLFPLKLTWVFEANSSVKSAELVAYGLNATLGVLCWIYEGYTPM